MQAVKAPVCGEVVHRLSDGRLRFDLQTARGDLFEICQRLDLASKLIESSAFDLAGDTGAARVASLILMAAQVSEIRDALERREQR